MIYKWTTLICRPEHIHGKVRICGRRSSADNRKTSIHMLTEVYKKAFPASLSLKLSSSRNPNCLHFTATIPIATFIMKYLQTLLVIGLSISPAISFPEPSNHLNPRQSTVTCPAGQFAQCCTTFLAGVGDLPTGTAAGCTDPPATGGCPVNNIGCCCMDLVCLFSRCEVGKQRH